MIQFLKELPVGDKLLQACAEAQSIARALGAQRSLSIRAGAFEASGQLALPIKRALPADELRVTSYLAQRGCEELNATGGFHFSVSFEPVSPEPTAVIEEQLDSWVQRVAEYLTEHHGEAPPEQLDKGLRRIWETLGEKLTSYAVALAAPKDDGTKRRVDHVALVLDCASLRCVCFTLFKLDPEPVGLPGGDVIADFPSTPPFAFEKLDANVPYAKKVAEFSANLKQLRPTGIEAVACQVVPSGDLASGETQNNLATSAAWFLASTYAINAANTTLEAQVTLPPGTKPSIGSSVAARKIASEGLGRKITGPEDFKDVLMLLMPLLFGGDTAIVKASATSPANAADTPNADVVIFLSASKFRALIIHYSRVSSA